ncbi:MAG: hypothetical protein HQL56_06730 [Magnetococcales bacterium]|nr:hypothetical protein [Magnetococcales bacterium]
MNLDQMALKMNGEDSSFYRLLGIHAFFWSCFFWVVPLLGPRLTVFTGLMAAFSAGRGMGWGVAALIANLANLFVFSPLLRDRIFGGQARGDELLYFSGLVMVQLLAFLVLMLWRQRIRMLSRGV